MSNGGACACSLKFARLHHLVLDESRKRVRRTPITPSSIRFANAPFRSEDTPSGASEQTRRNKKWTTTQFSKSPTLPGRGYSKAFLTRFWIASMKSPEVNSSSIYRMRSEEHTSELQSLMRISYAVFCLKKINNDNHTNNSQ